MMMGWWPHLQRREATVRVAVEPAAARQLPEAADRGLRRGGHRPLEGAGPSGRAGVEAGHRRLALLAEDRRGVVRPDRVHPLPARAVRLPRGADRRARVTP